MNNIIKKICRVSIMLLSAICIAALFKTVPVQAVIGRTVRVSTQKELNAAVKNPDVGKIIFRTESYNPVTIKANKGSRTKEILIDAPNANVTNKAVFLLITVEGVRDYVEGVSGNNIIFSDFYASITVESKKKVNELLIYNPNPLTNQDYTLKKGAKISELKFLSTSQTFQQYSIYEPEKRTVTYNYMEYNGTDYTYIYTLDTYGRILKIENQNPESGAERTYSYDKDGCLLKETGSDSRGSYQREYIYSSKHQLEKLVDTSAGNVDEWKYFYDEKGRQIEADYHYKSLDYITTKYTTKYDKKDRVTYEYRGKANEYTEYKYKYNSKGFLTKYRTYKKGKLTSTETYLYSIQGDLLKYTFLAEGSEGPTVYEYSYDEYGTKLEGKITYSDGRIEYI